MEEIDKDSIREMCSNKARAMNGMQIGSGKL